MSVKFKPQPLKRKESLSESNTVRLAYEPSAPTTGPTSPDYPKDRRCRSALKLASRVKQLAEGVWRWGRREFIYLSLQCHHQNDFCIKIGSDESLLMFQ